MKVEAAPAAAPAIPKQDIVPRSGTLPGLFTTRSGSSFPVTAPMKADVLYLACWYTEKDTVRTAVTLTRGAKVPREVQDQFTLRTKDTNPRIQ